MSKFSWKNWPYWLRGGIIAVIFFIIFFTIIFHALITQKNSIGDDSIWLIKTIDFLRVIKIIIAFPIVVIFLPSFISDDAPTLSQNLMFNTILYLYIFILGALVGWIYGKIKKRKNYA